MNRTPRFAWLLLIAGVLLFIAQVHWRPAALSIEMEIRNEQATRLLVPYFIGGVEKGYVVRMVESVGKYTTIRFPVDQPQLDAFRLIQVDGTSTIWLRNLRVARLGGKPVPIPAKRINAIGAIVVKGEDDQTTEVRAWRGPSGSEIAIEMRKPVSARSLPVVLDWLIVATLGLVCAAVVVLTRREQPPPEPRRFALKFSALLTGAYLLASAFGLNGSSSTAWSFYADHHPPDANLLAGSTKHIRSDEWYVQTPWILSQVTTRPSFPLLNPAVGDGPATLITSLPVRHWSVLFRPQFLPFFFLPLAQAFAFYWNFKWYALPLGAFLYLNTISRGRGWLALGGAAFVFFSGFTQWWFSSPTMMPEMIAMFFFALWAGSEIFRARSRWAIAGASLVLLFAIEQFVLCCYPRFQVPLAYLALFLALAGAFVIGLKRNLARASILAGTLVAAGVLVSLWQRDVAGLLSEIQALVYPGKTSSIGGNFPWLWHPAALLELGMSEHHFPKNMSNACEASGFLFLLPILIALAIRDAVRRRFDPVLIAIVGFLSLVVWFMSAGVPETVARWAGFWVVSAGRANLAIGIGSAIALVRYFALAKDEPERASNLVRLLGFAILVAAFWCVLHATNGAIARFVQPGAVAAAALFFALLYLLIWQGRAAASCLLLLVPLVYAHGLTNPIGHGLPGFTESALWQRIRTLHQSDPAARWLVLGRSGRSKLLAQFAKTTGAEVVGGNRCNPDGEIIRALDPEGNFREIYSRYGEISFQPGKEEAPKFELTSTTSYVVYLPITAATFDRLGPRYILAADLLPEETAIPGFEEIGAVSGCRILRAMSPPLNPNP